MEKDWKLHMIFSIGVYWSNRKYAIWWKLRSGTSTVLLHRYLIENPLANTAASRCLLKPLKSEVSGCLIILPYKISPIQLIYDGWWPWTCFRQFFIFPVIFKSGDNGGHCRASYLSLCMNAFIDLELCFQSLSCEHTQLLCNFNFVTDVWTL